MHSDDSSEPTDEQEDEKSLFYDTSAPGYAGVASVGFDSVSSAAAFAEMIVDSVRESLLVLDFDLRVKAANESFYRTFETHPDDTQDRLVYALGDGQWDIPELHRLLEEVLPHNRVFDDYEVEHEFEDLGRRVMLLNARRLDHHQMILLAIEDITEQRSAEAAVQTAEERYRLLVEGTREYAMLMLDADGKITMWNTGAERITGFTEDEVVGRPGAILFTEEDRRHREPENEREEAVREGQANDERWLLRKDGSRFWASGVLTPLWTQDGALRGFAKVLRDETKRREAETQRREAETKRRKAEEAIRELNETLEARVEDRTQKVRELASALTMAEQQERRRISQLLHDDLQQQLFAARLKLDVVRQAFLADRDAETMLDLFDALSTQLAKAGSMTRNLSVDLYPPILKSEGLADALDWLKLQMADLHGLTVEVVAAHSFRTPGEDLRVLLFGIVRELLFNVAKHAHTNRATVTLRDVDHHIEITVEDEGAGFDVAAAEAGTGFGLFSVRERLGLFGGQMKVASAPGEGTRIVMDVPLRLE